MKDPELRGNYELRYRTAYYADPGDTGSRGI